MPRPNACEPVRGDARDVAGPTPDWFRRELHRRPEINVREALEQRGRAPFGNPRVPIHHEILLESQRITPATKQGKRNARILANILDLLPYAHVPTYEFVVLDADPHDGDLGTAVRIESRQMRGRPS